MDRYDVYVLTRDGIRETECIEYEEDGDGRFVFYEDHLADRETYGDERVQEERERIVERFRSGDLRQILVETMQEMRVSPRRGVAHAADRIIDHLTPPAGGEG
jgi:hypothetical protein